MRDYTLSGGDGATFMVSEKQLKELGVKNWLDLANDFVGADLLLGNGFSLNLAGHFDYKSLFTVFLNNCNPMERKIFKSFGTNNFEIIQESLISTKKVNSLFGIKDKGNKIDDAINCLKNGLIKSIGETHPKASKIDFNQLHNLSLQFNNFGDIFTLNYDLFLYHIVMQIKDESDKNNVYAPYSDFFWGGEPDEQFKQFMGYDEYERNHVYYLHGALFLFRIPPDTFKLKRGGVSKELVTMIGDEINNGNIPLFVSEGRYKEKLKAIERSDYLGFCYGSLEESQNKLVIFGSSLLPQDTHIVNAINHRRNKRELALSVHVGTKSSNELESEIKRIKAKFIGHKIDFYNSETIFNF